MPVSKHRRRSKSATSQPDRAPEPSRNNITTLDELRQAIANPALDFSAKTVAAGVWWYQQLLRKAGDRRAHIKASWKDKRKAALLLCVAMDGEHGKNDDLSPVLAKMLRPHCPVPTFSEAWERANQLPPGTVFATATRILSPAAKTAE